MSKNQYNFNIKIPSELIHKGEHNKLNKKLLENKVILGFVGYARSGKDTITKKFIDDYGYHRIAFADNLKIEMNKYFKEIIYNFIKNRGVTKEYKHNMLDELDNGLFLEDGNILTMDMMDFQTDNVLVKKKLRPFIIWYGEKIREINGKYYWTNKAIEIDAAGYNNIIISDVRRASELDIFIESNSFIKRLEMESIAAGAKIISKKPKPYTTLLFKVNQLGLEDSDILTQECIRIAEENWLFEHTFLINPNLPETGSYRNNSINSQIKEVAKKFGISKPDNKLNFPYKQMSILDF